MSPTFREDCEMDLAELGEAAGLHVLLVNSDHFGRREAVGKVKFGEYVVGYRTGQDQWNESLSNPNRPITAWHPVFPPPPAPPRQLFPGGGKSRSSSRSRSRSRSPVFKLKQSVELQV